MSGCHFATAGFHLSRLQQPHHPPIDGVPGQIWDQVILWRILNRVHPLAMDKPVAPFGRYAAFLVFDNRLQVNNAYAI